MTSTTQSAPTVTGTDSVEGLKTGTTPAKLTFDVAGQHWGLLATQVTDKEHVYYPFRKGPKANFRGEQVPALATELPSSVTIDGVDIALEAGLTGKDGESGRRPKVSYHGPVTLPSLGIRGANVTISIRKDGGWNITVSVNRGARSASPEARAESAAKVQEANLAALDALFAS